MPLSLLSPLDRSWAPAPKPERVAWLSQHHYAHRGLHGANVPENSPAGFAAAIKQGFGIECDVQRSMDGDAVVFHDWELDRLTAESGPIAKRSAAQLGTIQLSGSGDCIPTLRQLLKQVHGHVPLLIEVKSRKDTRVTAFCMAIRHCLEGYIGPHAIMSFDPRIVGWFASHSPMTVRGLVITEENTKTLPGRIGRHIALWKAKPDFLAYDIRDLPSRFASAQRKRGLPVTSWTIRNADLRQRAELYADAPIFEGEGRE